MDLCRLSRVIFNYTIFATQSYHARKIFKDPDREDNTHAIETTKC